MTTYRKPLEDYLALEYPFDVIVDGDGGYVILYPDLPGCMTQVERLDEIPGAAEEIRRLWIETEYVEGADIPPPSYPEEYSGKFNLRLPKSLHRDLARAAERDGVSLNQYVVMLLSRREAEARVGRRRSGQGSTSMATGAERSRVHSRPAVSPTTVELPKCSRD